MFTLCACRYYFITQPADPQLGRHVSALSAESKLCWDVGEEFHYLLYLWSGRIMGMDICILNILTQVLESIYI